MQRWDIIQKFIDSRNYLSYTELGYYKGWSFENVSANRKVAIDPHPCKTIEMENAPYGVIVHHKGFGEYETSNTPMELIYKMTSDEFFERDLAGKSAFIFFIDGLHEYSQVYKDIQNCLKSLVPGGVIILHDMNPPLYEHTTTGIDGCWTGDAYKAFLQFQAEDVFGKYNTYVVDTDWGVGVIEKSSIEIGRCGIHDYNRGINDWNYFNENRKELLNLISVRGFLEKFEKRCIHGNIITDSSTTCRSTSSCLFSSTLTQDSTGNLIIPEHARLDIGDSPITTSGEFIPSTPQIVKQVP